MHWTSKQLSLDSGFKLPRLAPGLGHTQAQTLLVSITHQNERQGIGAGGTLQQAMRQVMGCGVVNRSGLAWACHVENLSAFTDYLQTEMRYFGEYQSTR